jgi:hypothetical protein
MLNEAQRQGHTIVISWLPHGKAFMIHDRPYFTEKIMPFYFKSRFTSFRQCLRSHGFFQMGTNGWDEGGYYHTLFVRDDPSLCHGMTQLQMNAAMPDWIPANQEPDFYETEAAEATSSSVIVAKVECTN